MPKKPPLHAEAWALAEEKMSSSGLDLEDLEALGMVVLGEAEARALHSGVPQVPCLQIPYFNVDGSPMTGRPGHPHYWRLRLLKPDTSIKALASKKGIKYLQPPNTPPCAYFARGTDWLEVMKDTSTAIILTEGELKAAKACKEGFVTIGLGGVNSWASREWGYAFLPELEAFDWVKRNVYICFDSDILSNGNVCAAAQGLADELERRGARVYLTILPQLEQGQKTGLDDFLVSDQADTMIEVLRLSSPIGIVDTLFDFSQRYLVVRDPGLIFDMQMGCRWSLSAFQESIENTKSYQERYLDKDGQVAWRMTAAGKAYVSWPLRTEVQKITYAPGQPAFVANSPVMYNQWPGWGCEPKKGSVAPFTALLDHLFTGAEPDARKWFLQWLAYPLQYPGTKLFSAAVIFGVVEGTGKSLVGYTMKRIYGKNFAEIGQDDLHSSDNDWAENVQFVLGEEITGSNSRQDADRLKKLITQLTVRINIKFIPKYSVPDCINYLFTSNQPTAVFLGDTDRRYFIHEVQVPPKPPAFYAKYLEWLNGDGPSALFDYLLQVDVSDFSPGAPAYKTAAKDRMTADNQSALGEWVRYLRDDPNEVLVIGGMASPYDLYSARELLSLYDGAATTKTTTNGLGREMKRAGFRQVLDGRPLKVPGRAQDRYYVVRNAEKWEKATGKQVLAHLSAVPEVKTPKY